MPSRRMYRRSLRPILRPDKSRYIWFSTMGPVPSPGRSLPSSSERSNMLMVDPSSLWTHHRCQRNRCNRKSGSSHHKCRRVVRQARSRLCSIWVDLLLLRHNQQPRRSEDLVRRRFSPLPVVDTTATLPQQIMHKPGKYHQSHEYHRITQLVDKQPQPCRLPGAHLGATGTVHPRSRVALHRLCPWLESRNCFLHLGACRTHHSSARQPCNRRVQWESRAHRVRVSIPTRCIRPTPKRC